MTKSKYRRLLAKALWSIRSHSGAEVTANAVLQDLIAFDKYLKAQDLDAGEIQLQFHPRSRFTCTVDDLLDLAVTNEIKGARIISAIRNGIPLPGMIVQIFDAVILPPSDGGPSLKSETEQASQSFALRFEPRTRELIELLERNGVYIDDCIFTKGGLHSKQMREQSYIIVEIPRLNRTVLVNDQVGEATYIVYGIGDPRRFFSLSKEDLAEGKDIRVRRVKRKDPVQWHEDIHHLLFMEDAWNDNIGQAIPNTPTAKMDISLMVEIRESILSSSIGTPEAWVATHVKEAMKMKIAGRTTYTVTKAYGYQKGRKISREIWLKLGIDIFGEHSLIMYELWLETLTPDDMRKAISESEWNTCEVWLELSLKKAQKIHVLGKGLGALTTIFDVDGKPYSKRDDYLQLVLAIFGPKEAVLTAIREEAMDADDIKEAIKETPWANPQAWIDFNGSHYSNVHIFGRSVRALNTLMGGSGAVTTRLQFLQLAEKLIGSSEELSKAIEYEAMDAEGIREAIQDTPFKDPQVWIDYPKKGITTFSLFDKGFRSLTTLFEVSVRKTRYNFLKLAEAILGSSEKLSEAMRYESPSKDDVREAVKNSDWNNPRLWIEKDIHTIRVLKFMGKGMRYLCNLFDIEGDPQKSKSTQLRFAKATLGDSEELSQAIFESEATIEDLREAVKHTPWGNPEVWLDLSEDERKQVKILGRGLYSLCNTFGIEGGPYHSRRVRLLLAKALLGDYEILTEALKKYEMV